MRLKLGIEVGAQTIIGDGSSRWIIASELTVVGKILLFELTFMVRILFPARTGADAIAAVVTTTS